MSFTSFDPVLLDNIPDLTQKKSSYADNHRVDDHQASVTSNTYKVHFLKKNYFIINHNDITTYEPSNCINNVFV